MRNTGILGVVGMHMVSLCTRACQLMLLDTGLSQIVSKTPVLCCKAALGKTVRGGRRGKVLSGNTCICLAAASASQPHSSHGG